MSEDLRSSSPVSSAYKRFERWIEIILFSGRWLMAPLYVGLLVVLGAVAVKFLEELVLTLPHILSMEERKLVISY